MRVYSIVGILKQKGGVAPPRAVRKIIPRLPVCLALLMLACAFGATKLRAADKPLTRDDVTLLLLGGATSQKMVELINARGVSFQVTAELANEFRRDGADDAVIQALESASGKGVPASPASSSAAGPSGASAAPASPPTTPSAPPASSGQSAAAAAPPSTSGPSLIRRPSPASAPVASAPNLQPAAGTPSDASAARVPSANRSAALPPSSAAPAPSLSDPAPERIEQIIQTFAAKETLFKLARDNYTYHQINKVEEIGADGETTGFYEQDWDILYDDNSNRIERVTYAPLSSLKQVLMTEQDLDAFRNIQPFVLTTDELPEYDIKYLGHVKVDEITAYVFSVRPKEIKKGKQYFQGIVWVDDRDLQIVKSEGKNVPEEKKKGEENLFPRFTTWREQIDGKFWFPTFTLADDTLYFTAGPVHLKEIVKYTEYKQFKSSVTIKVAGVVPGTPPQKANTPPKP